MVSGVSGCVSIILLDVTFIGAFPHSDAQSEVQFLRAGISRRRWDAGVLLKGDSCRESQVQLPFGGPDVESAFSSCH